MLAPLRDGFVAAVEALARLGHSRLGFAALGAGEHLRTQGPVSRYTRDSGTTRPQVTAPRHERAPRRMRDMVVRVDGGRVADLVECPADHAALDAGDGGAEADGLRDGVARAGHAPAEEIKIGGRCGRGIVVRLQWVTTSSLGLVSSPGSARMPASVSA